MKIICIIYNIIFDDMGDYRIVVTSPENVTEHLDMSLRVLAEQPRVKFINPSSFYQANRLLSKKTFLPFYKIHDLKPFRLAKVVEIRLG